MLSSLASLSSYLQHHKTTPASHKFKNAVASVNTNLGAVLSRLTNVSGEDKNAEEEQECSRLRSGKMRKIKLVELSFSSRCRDAPD